MSATGVKTKPGLILRAILAEPLTHFLLIGAALFLGINAFSPASGRYVIDVGDEQIARIVRTYAQQYGSPPTADQLRSIVDGYVREEVFVREGRALGLDRDDEIIRRRIAQKFEFLRADTHRSREPSDDEVRAYYNRHASAFLVPAKRSFDHVYFAVDLRGEAAAQARARQTLAAAMSGSAVSPASGNDFPGPSTVAALPYADLTRVFGGEGFATKVFAAPLGHWAGPFRSGFGWHVVRVTSQTPPFQPPFEMVRDEARASWKEEDQAERERRSYLGLVARYRIERADAAK